MRKRTIYFSLLTFCLLFVNVFCGFFVRTTMPSHKSSRQFKQNVKLNEATSSSGSISSGDNSDDIPKNLIVMSGDSTMRAQYKNFIIKYNFTSDSSSMILPNYKISSLSIAGGHAKFLKSMPTTYSTCDHVKSLLTNTKYKYDKITVYLNFGLLHLLHVYPHRPWVVGNASDVTSKYHRYADFNGFFNLENW